MKKNGYANTTIQQIRLYDFRHYYATMLYHKTKDLLHVKARLGHKDLRTTLRYTQLLETLEDDEYHCKTATNIKEATQLIETGFEYVAEKDEIALFRKRKYPLFFCLVNINRTELVSKKHKLEQNQPLKTSPTTTDSTTTQLINCQSSS
ncbi:MAG: site-specific integrase [Candidatus Bathyarchaeota archaeon]